MLKKFIIVSIISVISSISAMAAGPRQSAVNRFVNSKALTHATAGVCVMDIKTGKTIAGYNTDKGIVSASTMKIVTSASALEILGKNYTYHTRVYAIGNTDNNGKFSGQIMIKGCGDPTLGSRFFDEHTAFVDTLVYCIENHGINSIDGEIMLDKSGIPDTPIPGYWMLEDISESYGTGYHAVNFADNQMKIKFTYHDDGTYSAGTDPEMPWMHILCNLRRHITGDTANRPGITTRINYNDTSFEINGIVAKRRRGKEDFASWYANPAPDRLLVDSIKNALALHDIALNTASIEMGGQKADTLLLLDYKSPSLSEIIKSTLFRSDNMFAEALLRTLPANASRPATSGNGVGMVNRLWKAKGLDTDQLAMKDGSGLARNGWTTPKFLCDVLRTVYTDRRAIGTDYSELLPRAGREGSVKWMLRRSPLRGNIVLKSGSMGGVQCYAGYYPAKNPQYAVAVMVNNFSEKRKDVVKQVETLLEDLFAPNSNGK